MPAKSAPYKAIMIFNNAHDATGYKEPVYLHDSVNGVQQITFLEYLEIIQKPHEGAYKLVKVYPENTTGTEHLELTGFDALMLADINFLRQNARHKGQPCRDEAKMLSVKNAFRSIWYNATKEVMDL